MVKSSIKTMSVVLTLLLAASICLVAQTGTTGVVLGTVSDPSGAVISTAKVSLIDVGSNFTTTSETIASGRVVRTGIF